ncbi:MAG: SpoVR family protein [Caldilineaceae bacterium]|nr:SpoVR family protein [Caldilineaceae bacterium]
MNQSVALPAHLQDIQQKVEGYARDLGLDFPEVRFIMLDFSQINQVAAYDGFPRRYPHWRFGMEYERLRKSYAWGLHRIYEMVINTDPCYAYLLASNLDVDQKLVMAHVYGHADFFKNNLWFAHTNRQMLDEMANHATRISRYMDKYGYEEVEAFIDRCLSLENLIDIHQPSIRRLAARPQERQEDAHVADANSGRLRASGYMDSFINPPEYLAEMRQRAAAERQREKQFPVEPQKDVLLFLLEYAPLEPWQQDIVAIVREEALYFAPQRQTKIMNEGWASFWHSTIMTRHALSPDELIDYADHHSGTLATSPGRLNPYKLGIELLRDVEDRWNRGAFGPEYEACTSQAERARWDRKLGLGREKIFEVRRIYNDIGFIDEFLTRDFAEAQQLFSYRYNRRARRYEVESRDFDDIKRQLLTSLTNFGEPAILVQDANFQNRGELYLRHVWEEVDLRLDYAQDTLENVQALWQRPVHLETHITDRGLMQFSYDGKEHSQKLLVPQKV